MSTSRYHGIEAFVGRTPLIRLRRLSELTGCEILGKAEFMNPGGSVKDRAALSIIMDAESTGRLRPGDTIVEGTAGNTGIGLAVIGHAKGYRTVITIPETQSQEKISLLRTLGAEVRHRWHTSRHGFVSEGTQQSGGYRMRRPIWCCNVVLVCAWPHGSQGWRVLRRRNRPDARNQKPRRHSGEPVLPYPGPDRFDYCLSTFTLGRGCFSAFLPASI